VSAGTDNVGNGLKPVSTESSLLGEMKKTYMTGLQGGDKEIYNPCIRKLAHPVLKSKINI
jgi:hypothetical protein